MQRALEGSPELEWQRDALRRSAMAASVDSRRSLWAAGLALGATVVFGLGMVFMPGGFGLSAPGLETFRPFFEQTRGLPTGDVSSERLQTLGHPLWLLLGRLTGNLAPVALILSGVSAIVSLFLAYQVCHGLSDPERADEQACYALPGLALTPPFFVAAAGGGTELPHLALVLGAVLCAHRALLAESPLAPLAFSGLLFGLSLLIRPISLLVAPAVLLWLVSARPFGRVEAMDAVKSVFGFLAAFAVGAAPALLVHMIYHTSPVSWGPSELGMLWGRLVADPLRMVLAIGEMIVQYVTADDVERLGGIGGSWQDGDLLGLPGAMIALAPTILKLLGAVGLICLLWLERFQAIVDRVRLPAALLAFFIVGGALGLVEERSSMVLVGLLVIFAFSGLPSLLPGAISGVLGMAMIGCMLLYQLSGAQLARQSPPFRASDKVASELRTAGATPNEVMSANWSFYDTRSPWKNRYLHIPAYVNSTEALIREMKRQGARYLVFDRRAGSSQWPRLAELIDTELPRRGLRPLGSPLTTPESPPNTVAIYILE